MTLYKESFVPSSTTWIFLLAFIKGQSLVIFKNISAYNYILQIVTKFLE